MTARRDEGTTAGWWAAGHRAVAHHRAAATPLKGPSGATSRVNDDMGPLRGSTTTRRHDETTRRRGHAVVIGGFNDCEDVMLRVLSLLTERGAGAELAIDCAFAVHRELGPGFREKIYDTVFCPELMQRHHVRA